MSLHGLVATAKYRLMTYTMPHYPESRLLLLLILLPVLASCGLLGGMQPSGPKDGAPSTRIDPKTIKDAVPREEPRSR